MVHVAPFLRVQGEGAPQKAASPRPTKASRPRRHNFRHPNRWEEIKLRRIVVSAALVAALGHPASVAEESTVHKAALEDSSTCPNHLLPRRNTGTLTANLRCEGAPSDC